MLKIGRKVGYILTIDQILTNDLNEFRLTKINLNLFS